MDERDSIINQLNAPPDPSAAHATPDTKRPYEKPAFRCERIFETTALACGKINATQSSCRASRRAS